MSQEQIAAAMRQGAGLPVLSVLDEVLSAKADGQADAALRARALDEVTGEIRSWLTEAQDRIHQRLAACDPGPLKATLEDHLETTVAARRQALDDVAIKAETGNEEAAWALLEAEFVRLHTFREELGHLTRAAQRLQEVAQLVEDIPDDDQGRQALDELAQLEAMAASHPTPAKWAEATLELEEHCLDHVRLDTPDPDPVPEPEPQQVTWEPAETNGANGNGHANGNGNGHGYTNGNGHANGKAALAGTSQPTQIQPGEQRSTFQRLMDRRNGGQPTTGRPAAGTEVLSDWRERFDTDHRQHNQAFRHGPLWAPIAAGRVPAPDGSTDSLLEIAHEVEIDLVDIELPRILALTTGHRPEQLHAALAQKAEDISRKDPKRVAREAFLDYLVGKLPKRYRETAEGLALVESITYALARDEPWEASDHDYGQIIQNLVERELDRTPAVDLEPLAHSLIGARPEALELVLEAAETLADEDADIQLHDDGILVRALTEREDPDKLYKLRGTLEARMGKQRARQLINALITTKGEQE